MTQILVIDNDGGFNESLEKSLAGPMEESAKVKAETSLKDENSLRALLAGTSLVLLDLELSYHKPGSVLSDYRGRDQVLPMIRQIAPWVPVVLMSQHISGDVQILAQLTPFEFDAVLPKEFFESANASAWTTLRRTVALKRVAALTGRTLLQIEQAVSRNIRIEYGRGVADALRDVPTADLRQILCLLDLGADRLVLDEVVQGFSGLAVVRVSCFGGGPERQWLLKVGSAVSKLWREAQAHRRMFVGGFTRHLSVPLLFWTPIFWGGFGGIAYEFERDAETLLSAVDRLGPARALRRVALTLEDLYRGGRRERVVPRDQLRRAVGGASVADEDLDRVPALKALRMNISNEESDRSVEVLVSRQHGDLHTRNILLRPEVGLLIDFAHYTAIEENGVPLLDLAKLAVDLCVFGKAKMPARHLTSGLVLSKGPISRLAIGCGVVGEAGPTADELRLFCLAVRCYMAVYCSYPDMPIDRKRSIRVAIA